MTGEQPDLLDACCTSSAARSGAMSTRAGSWPDARFGRSPAFRPETITAYIARMSAGGRAAYLRRADAAEGQAPR